MDLLAALLLGIIEGLTEFLPVSSTGHMILTTHLLGLTDESIKTFEVFVQLGAVLAVVVLYFNKFIDMLVVSIKPPKTGEKRLNMYHIILAMIPGVVGGVVLRDFIKQYLFGAQTVVWSLIAGGILMIIADKVYKRRAGASSANTVDQITYKQAAGIGLFQMFALWPGFSRSGSTISGGLLLGVSHTAAAEFTFLLSVPMMVGATGYDLLKSASHLSMDDFSFFATGFIAAFVVAMLAIKTFLNLLKRLPFAYFAYYRFVLAIVFMIFFL
ncbi:undecaprenyl-diphosphate phosphatase [Paenibacillus sp. 481]|uniref:undecaprenyl-diphosphate phosphatase n=1 Tax=Paenibacillus sp. 481 TaxID=2835869 RepID=UPI001E43E8DE|nr:undecaprenyl-diphosphate phosphatase [Paenibacillus sp. 481]UHA72696.1 undecaprenyl-diphosphate phosphatase [Paenibacillus sp. 481]